jgi:integrase
LNESKGFAYTIEELEKISKHGDKLEGPNKIVWSRFMVQCYCGCRYSDLDTVMDEGNIKYDKEGMKYIEYRQQKTFNISNVNWHTDFEWLFPIAKKEKYLNSWMNVLLKEIAKDWDVPLNKKKPSTHDARRTFISCCLLKNIPIGDLMNFSGHSEIKSIQRYNKFIGREAISSIHNPMMSDSQVREAVKKIEDSKKKLPRLDLSNSTIILKKG